MGFLKYKVHKATCLLAGLVRQRHHADPLPANAEEGRRPALAPGPHFDRTTRQPGRTAVLHALGLLNFATGRLDPSYAAIARMCERTVATALARLRKLGIPHWVRRCCKSWRGCAAGAGRSHESRAILTTCSNFGKSY